MKKNNKKVKLHKINKEIKNPIVFLIDEEKNIIGEVSIQEALLQAFNCKKDLVQISFNKDNIPVCKIIDYGRFCFELKKNKKKNKKTFNKEIQVRPLIEENDFNVKLKRLIKFLKEGNKVVLFVKYRGRENIHLDVGLKVLNKFIKEIEDIAKVEIPIKQENRKAFVVLAPKKN